MFARITTTTLGLCAAALLVGCAAPAKRVEDVSFPTENWETRPPVKPIAPPPVLDRLPQGPANPLEDGKLYSFKAQRLPLHLALNQFATLYKLNIVIDRDIEGMVTVDLTALPLDKIFEAMLEAQGYSWFWDNGLIRVTKVITRTFQIDYLRISRTGMATSSAASSAAGGGSGRSSLSSNDSINFWTELEGQINALLTGGDGGGGGGGSAAAMMETTTTTDKNTNTVTATQRPIPEAAGRAIINRLSGTVQVTASRGRVKRVEEFLKALMSAATRQVQIDAKIVEVTLAEDNAFGIDWTRITHLVNTDTGEKQSRGFFSTSTNITSPIGGLTAKAATVHGTYTTANVAAVLNALQEQGNVRVISQPRIRTLNNQAAIVKVGTDRTFFATTSTVVPSAAGTPLVTTTNTPTTVTEGLTLTVTPQISADGIISMDVSPGMTRITGVSVSPDGLSNAPEIEVKQASTIVRVRDGETATIGGMIQETDSVTTREIPGAAELGAARPLLGTTYRGRQRREIVIFLTPYLVDM